MTLEIQCTRILPDQDRVLQPPRRCVSGVILRWAPHNNSSGSRAEREKGRRGRNSKQPISVWLSGDKAAPGGLDQRAGGHREKIAEGRNQSYVGSVTGEPPSCRGGTGAGCLRLTTLVNLCGALAKEDAMGLLTRLSDWWVRSPFSDGVTKEDRRRWARQQEAWEDAMIAEEELHQANEDMCFPGDPPWFDVCEEVGDGHSHYVPSSLTAAMLAPSARESEE